MCRGHVIPFFELGKAKAAKGEGWVPLSLAVPQMQWDSNPTHCPYGLSLWFKHILFQSFGMNTYAVVTNKSQD